MKTDMNYCRRCGSKFVGHKEHVYKCGQGHTIYLNSSPAVALLLFNDKGELAVLTRSINPGLGKLDFPGGFCDGTEPVDHAVFREIEEEIGVKPNQYKNMEFVYSGIDAYELDGEDLPVVSIVFKAEAIGEIELKALDDAATAQWLSLGQINRDQIFFPSMKASFDKMLAEKL